MTLFYPTTVASYFSTAQVTFTPLISSAYSHTVQYIAVVFSSLSVPYNRPTNRRPITWEPKPFFLSTSHCNNSLCIVNRLFGMTEHKQRIVASSDATSKAVRFFLDEVCCNNNPWIDDNRRKSVQDMMSSILPAEIQLAINNVLVVNDAYLRAAGNYFHHL